MFTDANRLASIAIVVDDVAHIAKHGGSPSDLRRLRSDLEMLAIALLHREPTAEELDRLAEGVAG